MLTLQRITTEYAHLEDRIRLSGEGENAETLTVWLTQRLLTQVITHLFALIEKQPKKAGESGQQAEPVSSLMQGFAQQAAEADIAPEPRVESRTEDEAWLVKEVDIAVNPQGAMALIFKREIGPVTEQSDEGFARLNLDAKQLRQWLSIVHTQWQLAAWPPSLWPTWMGESSIEENTNPLH